MALCGGGDAIATCGCGEGVAGGSCVAAGGGDATSTPVSAPAVAASGLVSMELSALPGAGEVSCVADGGGAASCVEASWVAVGGGSLEATCADGGGGGAATGSVPPRSASALYFARSRSAASDWATCCCSCGVLDGSGRSGIDARSGDSLAPSKVEGELSLPTQVVGSTQSGMLEHALAPKATIATTPKRAQIFVTCIENVLRRPGPLAGASPAKPIYRESPALPSDPERKYMKSCNKSVQAAFLAGRLRHRSKTAITTFGP